MMSGIERDWATRADYGWRGSAARTASKPEFGFQGEAAVVTTLSSAILTRSTLFCSPMNSVPTPIAAVVVSYSTLGSMFTRGCLVAALRPGESLRRAGRWL